MNKLNDRNSVFTAKLFRNVLFFQTLENFEPPYYRYCQKYNFMLIFFSSYYLCKGETKRFCEMFARLF